MRLISNTHRRSAAGLAPRVPECIAAERSPKRAGQARRLNDACDAAAPRRAFTLVEMLMVITVIAILMTIVLKVTGKFIDTARHAATETTLSKMQTLMNSRRQAFDRLIQRKGFITGSNEFRYFGTAFSGEQQKIMTRKLLQMKYFPQSSNDLTTLLTISGNMGGTPAQRAFASMYPSLFTPASTDPLQPLVVPVILTNATTNRPPSNPEILYAMLTQGGVTGDSPVGTDAFSSSDVSSNPAIGAGLPFFIDAWQTPIVFYRWPTRLFLSTGWPDTRSATQVQVDVQNAKMVFSSLPVFTGNLASDLKRDPDDPLQTCTSIAAFETTFHTPATYHIPLIVSAGPDQQFGLGQPDPSTFANPLFPMSTSNPSNPLWALAWIDPTYTPAQDQLADNIVSASIKAGGR